MCYVEPILTFIFKVVSSYDVGISVVAVPIQVSSLRHTMLLIGPFKVCDLCRHCIFIFPLS